MSDAQQETLLLIYGVGFWVVLIVWMVRRYRRGETYVIPIIGFFIWAIVNELRFAFA